MRKWTRNGIIRYIVERDSSGLRLTQGGEGGVDSTLCSAAARIFGTWRNAVMAAGIAPARAPGHDRWPPSKILSLIRMLSRRRHPLPSNEFKRRYGTLVRAARRHFGTWSKAVIAAGIDPIRLRRMPPWNQERIIEAILIRALRNEPLGCRTVLPRSLAEAAVRSFGRWGLALAAAGLDPNQYSGARLAPVHVRKHQSNQLDAKPDPMPDTTGKSALVTAGASGAPTEGPGWRWTKESIREAIIARWHDGRKVNATAVYKDCCSLYQAARRKHGTWRNALLDAGLTAGVHKLAGPSVKIVAKHQSEIPEFEAT